MRPAQLAKEHRHKLGPALETPGVALSAVLRDQLLKLQARKKLEQLGKDATKSLHGGPFVWFYTHGTKVPERTSRFNFQRAAQKLIWTRVSGRLQGHL
jgi:hypothetical protein